jgi:DNA-binding MarR family transcriptional regulator
VSAAGLVRRGDDPADARAARIELTDRAREFAPVAAEVVEGLEDEVDRSLSAAEARALRRALRKLGDL